VYVYGGLNVIGCIVWLVIGNVVWYGWYWMTCKARKQVIWEIL